MKSNEYEWILWGVICVEMTHRAIYSLAKQQHRPVFDVMCWSVRPEYWTRCSDISRGRIWEGCDVFIYRER